MNRPNRILVVPGDRSLDEAIRTVPLCYAIMSNLPGIHLSVGYFRETQRVVLESCLEKCQLLRFFSLKLTKPRHCWRAIKYFPYVLRSMLGYDTIVLLHLKDSHWPLSFLAKLTTARVFDKNLLKYCSEATRELLHQDIARQLFESKGHQEDALRYLPRLRLSDEDKNYAEGFFIRNGLVGSRTVFVNPYRASKTDGWGLRKYINLAKAISGCGAKVLMHEKGGPDETLGAGGIQDKEEFSSLRRELKSAGVVSAGNTSLKELIALIDRCDMTAGEPSGPLVIAAALGKPTVTITPNMPYSLASFLPSVSYGWGLSDAKHTVLVHDDSQQVAEGAAASILVEKLARWRNKNACHSDVLSLSDETVQVLGGQNAYRSDRLLRENSAAVGDGSVYHD